MALALTGLSAVIAITARAPLSHATPIDARSAATPVTALWLLALGAGIVALTAVSVLLWPGRRRRGDDEPEFENEVPPIHWLWKLAAIILPFALGAALLAAVFVGLKATGTAVAPQGTRPPTAPLTAPPMPQRPVSAAHGFTVPAWLPWTLLGIVLLALAVGAIALWRWWREPATIAASDAEPASAAVQAAMTALDTIDDPRAAVITAYAAMQDTLAARGVPRSPTEAPREYLRRVLRASDASEAGARTLTGLFEEARFSTHPISESVRRRALSALSAVRTELGGTVTQ